MLWSKLLPVGNVFDLSDEYPGAYLHHYSSLGEFFLSSDSIGHTYRYVKAMAPIVGRISDGELEDFFAICSTIGAYTVFPSNRFGRKPTINGARGLHPSIKDRFDLSLECIRCHYLGIESPLGGTLARYADFFSLFGSFREYVNFFLLQDLVSEDGNAIRFFLPFNGFGLPPLPRNLREYRTYKDGLTAFITARNGRIADLV